MCNIKINIVFRAEKITNLNLIHVSVFSYPELASNPEHRWNRVRRYLLNKGVPLFELTLLEDDFVCRFLENKSFDDFPNNKIAKTLDDDIRAILQSFTANALFKILVG